MRCRLNIPRVLSGRSCVGCAGYFSGHDRRVQLFVRKRAHLTEYAILGLFLARAFISAWKNRPCVTAVVIWLIALGWAALDEFRQSFVASRTGSPSTS